jgi:5-formyltetrahydrofolate cyclo-ligase
VSEAVRPQAAHALAAHLAAHPVFQASVCISAYYPNAYEIDTRPLIYKIWEMGKKCYLPVLHEGGILKFVRYQEGDALEKNELGILEPVDHTCVKEASQLCMILLPLVAYDQQGHRLGSGGGYYDRTLAFTFDRRPDLVYPHLAGVAFAAQAKDTLPTDPWDVRLDSVITERGVKFFN